MYGFSGADGRGGAEATRPAVVVPRMRRSRVVVGSGASPSRRCAAWRCVVERCVIQEVPRPPRRRALL